MSLDDAARAFVDACLAEYRGDPVGAPMSRSAWRELLAAVADADFAAAKAQLVKQRPVEARRRKPLLRLVKG